MTTPRQEYWQNLRIIRTATGQWVRRISFAAAREWVDSYQYETSTGYPADRAAQRAYDYMVYNKRGTLVLKEMAV